MTEWWKVANDSFQRYVHRNALFLIPRTALRPFTLMVRGRFVDDMKNGHVKSRFVAAEVARDVRHDVHAATPALKALRMIVSLAATRDGRHRPRSIWLRNGGSDTT